MANNAGMHRGDAQERGITIKLARLDTLEDGLMVHLSGYLNTYNTDYFHRQVLQRIEGGYTKLIFRCGELTYLSSTGIGSFSQLLKVARNRGGGLVFCELTPQVYEIFQLLGFSEVFSIRHTLDAALDAFQRLDTAEDGPPKSLDFTCPACGSPVQGASGRFRCGRCKTLLALDAQGTVFLG